MKKSLLALAAISVVAAAFAPRNRARTHDVAYGYRMGAGFAGDVNRTHPAAIFPAMLSQTAGETPASYGVGLLFNTGSNTVRQIKAADASDATPIVIAGVLVRPWPVQAGSSAGAFGQQSLTDVTAPVSTAPNDYLQSGRIMVKVNGNGTLNIDSDVYIWAAASAGAQVLGQFSTAFSAGNTVKVANAKFRGPADANGIAELEVWPSK